MSDSAAEQTDRFGLVGPCPNDTNGDGNCGRATCARCHPEYQPKSATFADRDALLDRQATGCQYDAGLCACPQHPFTYPGCKAPR